MPETTLSRLGWALSGLFALFMLGASVAPKLLGMAVAQETMAALGWPEAPIGSLELLCTLLFLFPPAGVLAGGPDDGHSGRGHGHADQGGQSAIQPCVVRHLFGRGDVGRVDLARCAGQGGVSLSALRRYQAAHGTTG